MLVLLSVLLLPLVSSQSFYSGHPSLPAHTYSFSSFHPHTVAKPSLYQPHAVAKPSVSLYQPHAVAKPSVSLYQPHAVAKPIVHTYQPHAIAKPIVHTYQPHAVAKPDLKILPLPYQQPQAYLATPYAGLAGSGDIVQQTRAQAESLKRDLRSMASNPRAANILRRVFAEKNNACINNIEEAIQAIETSTRLFENAGLEIRQLVQSVKVFEKQTDTPTAVRETAKIMRLLDVLIPKMTPTTPSACRTAGVDEFASLRSLADLVNELSSADDLYFSIQKRQSLKSSAKIVLRVTNFLTQLKRSFAKFDQYCGGSSDNIEAITAIGDMMTDLAGLYRDLGGFTAAEEISKQGDFTKKVVANIKKLGDQNIFPSACTTPGSAQFIANNLDDLAGLIEEVGMENLCRQLDLGSDCSFL